MRQRDIKHGMLVVINCKDAKAFSSAVKKLTSEPIGRFNSIEMPHYHGRIGSVTHPKYFRVGRGWFVQVRFEDGISYYWPSPCLQPADAKLKKTVSSKVEDLAKQLSEAEGNVKKLKAELEKAKKSDVTDKIKPGAVFKYESGGQRIVLSCNFNRTIWFLNGLDDDAFVQYSNKPMTKDQLIRHLTAHKYKFIKQLGKLI